MSLGIHFGSRYAATLFISSKPCGCMLARTQAMAKLTRFYLTFELHCSVTLNMFHVLRTDWHQEAYTTRTIPKSSVVKQGCVLWANSVD